MRPKYSSFLLLIIFLFSSCSDVIDGDTEEILQAHIEITNGNCQAAIDILDAMSDITTNAQWHIAKASAQACFSTFREPTFFKSDINSIDTTSLTTLGRSFAAMTTSDDTTTATDIDYTGLYDGLTTLISAGGVATNTFASRGAVFTSNENQNISLQATYLGVAALGAYMRFFGNGDSTGQKGAGGQGNNCYMDYTDGTAAGFLGASTGSCVGAGSAHADMTDTLACNGVVIVNSVFNLLQNISVPTDSGSLSNIDDTINTIITTCQGSITGSNAICTIVDQDLCEAEGNTQIQRYYTLVMEQIHL